MIEIKMKIQYNKNKKGMQIVYEEKGKKTNLVERAAAVTVQEFLDNLEEEKIVDKAFKMTEERAEEMLLKILGGESKK